MTGPGQGQARARPGPGEPTGSTTRRKQGRAGVHTLRLSQVVAVAINTLARHPTVRLALVVAASRRRHPCRRLFRCCRCRLSSPPLRPPLLPQPAAGLGVSPFAAAAPMPSPRRARERRPNVSACRAEIEGSQACPPESPSASASCRQGRPHCRCRCDGPKPNLKAGPRAAGPREQKAKKSGATGCFPIMSPWPPWRLRRYDRPDAGIRSRTASDRVSLNSRSSASKLRMPHTNDHASRTDIAPHRTTLTAGRHLGCEDQSHSSFPTEQTAINAGPLITWNSDIAASQRHRAGRGLAAAAGAAGRGGSIFIVPRAEDQSACAASAACMRCNACSSVARSSQ
jgi:hypothetical protein